MIQSFVVTLSKFILIMNVGWLKDVNY